jgi:hypothetical protein
MDADCLITCDDSVLVETELEILGTEYSSTPLMESIVFTPDTGTDGRPTLRQFTERSPHTFLSSSKSHVHYVLAPLVRELCGLRL